MTDDVERFLDPVRQIPVDAEAAWDQVQARLDAGPVRSRRPLLLAAGVAVVLVAAVLVAVTRGPAPGGRAVTIGTAPTSTTPGSFDPLSLVGRWSVAATGEPSGSVLRLSDDLVLFRHCGELFGSWTSDDQGLFAGTVMGFSSACHGSDGEATWLSSASAARRTPTGVELLDNTGAVVAMLTPGPAPSQRLDTSAKTDIPVPTPTLIARLTGDAPLAAGLTAATATDVLGRWRPDPQTRTPSNLIVDADGTWSGSDGCNGSSGRWGLASQGALVATSGGSTDVGCNGKPVPYWWSGARRVGFDGSTMVLLDHAGHETGRLVRDDTPRCRPGQITATPVAGQHDGGTSNLYVNLHNPGGDCLLVGDLSVVALDTDGDALAGPQVDRLRSALLLSRTGRQVQLTVVAHFATDTGTTHACTDNDVKPPRIRLSSTELGTLTVGTLNSLRTCRGQLADEGNIFT